MFYLHILSVTYLPTLVLASNLIPLFDRKDLILHGSPCLGLTHSKTYQTNIKVLYTCFIFQIISFMLMYVVELRFTAPASKWASHSVCGFLYSSSIFASNGEVFICWTESASRSHSSFSDPSLVD